MFSQSFRNRLFLLLLACGLANGIPLSAQQSTDIPEKPQPDYPMQMVEDEEGNRFVNQHQAYQFLYAGSETGVNKTFSSENGSDHRLGEGATTITITDASGNEHAYKLFVDGTPPSSIITFENAPIYEDENGTTFVGQKLQINFASDDNISGVRQQYWALNEQPFTVYNGQNIEFVNNESYLLYYYAVDRVGNTETPSVKPFQVDVTGPEVSFSIDGPGNVNVLSSRATILLNATDNASGVNTIMYQIDDASPNEYSTPILLNKLDDGEHQLKAWSVDNTENTGDTLRYQFYLDQNSPDLLTEILGVHFRDKDDIYLSPSASIAILADDNRAGTDNITYQINQLPERLYSEPIQIPEENGSYTLTYSASDAVGNTGDKQSMKVFLDNKKPSTRLRFEGYYSSTSGGFAIQPQTTISLNASDLESGIDEIRYKVGKEDWKTYQEPFQLSETEETQITFYAVDNVGNREFEQNVMLKIIEEDLTAQLSGPERVASQPSSFDYMDGELKGPDTPVYLWLSAHPSDTAQSYLLSHSSDSSQTFPINLYTDKQNVIEVTVFQEDSRSDYPVLVDATPPETELTHSSAQTYTQRDELISAPGMVINLEADDKLSGVKTIFVSENGGRYQPYDKPLSGYFSERLNIIRYYSADSVGNEEEVHEFQFTVDATPPITTHSFTGRFSGSNLSPNTTFTLQSDDNKSGVKNIFVQLNDEDPQVYSGGEVRLGDLGTPDQEFSTIYYYAVDNVGNTEQKKQFNFSIDAQGPEVQYSWRGNYFKKDTDSYFIHPEAELNIDANDAKMEIDEKWFRLSGGLTQRRTTYTEPLSFPESLNQSVTITVGAVDELGNQGDEAEIDVTVDASAPTTTYAINGEQISSVNSFILGSGAAISLSARDSGSGIKSTTYQINNQAPKSYSNPIRFYQSGAITLTIGSTDNVGNREDKQKISFIYDAAAPEITWSFSKEPVSERGNVLTLPENTLISISASDSESEVQSLKFKRNEEDDYKTYYRPLKIKSSDQAQKLYLRSVDLLGNERIEELTITTE